VADHTFHVASGSSEILGIKTHTFHAASGSTEINGIKTHTFHVASGSSIILDKDYVPPQEVVDDFYNVSQGVLTNLDVLSNDISIVGGETITITTLSANSATVTVNGATIDYTSQPLFSGVDTFEYDVGTGSPALVTVTVLIPHKAWRIVVGDNNGASTVSMAELKLLSGGVNQGLNTGTTYESSFSSASTKADKLFDDDTNTQWITGTISFSTTDTVINWHSVDKNLQTKPFIGWNDGIGNPPENSTIIHHLNIYDENDVLIRTETFPFVSNNSSYSYIYTAAQELIDSSSAVLNTSLRIEIWVTRQDTFDLDGNGAAPYDIESWQRFDHRFNRL